jgi:hypothetical protein
MSTTGKVKNQAISMFLTVSPCKFLMPLEATIEPAIPEDKTCVVLTGNPK